MDVWVKRNPAAPEGLFAWEAAGLRWLAGAESGVPCVRVLDQDATSLTLQKLEPAKPDPLAAHEFGGRLARTHAAAAAAFGRHPRTGGRAPATSARRTTHCR
jgi:fructosamine-3-kinase